METSVLIGGGLAGAKAAETLRAEGFDGRVVLVAEEPEPPYVRPPLSKGCLLGSDEREKARVHEPGWYEAHDVDLRTGVRAVRLDAAGHRVELARGRSWPTTGCCSPPARRPAGCPFPGPTWTASGTCGRWQTPTG